MNSNHCCQGRLWLPWQSFLPRGTIGPIGNDRSSMHSPGSCNLRIRQRESSGSTNAGHSCPALKWRYSGVYGELFVGETTIISDHSSPRSETMRSTADRAQGRMSATHRILRGFGQGFVSKRMSTSLQGHGPTLDSRLLGGSPESPAPLARPGAKRDLVMVATTKSTANRR